MTENSNEMAFIPEDPNPGWVWDEYNQDWVPTFVRDKQDENPDFEYQHPFDQKKIREKQAELEKQRKKERREKEKLEKKQNKSVYISGLPEDIEEEELVKFMQKAGILKKDEETLKPKLKIYQDESGNIKGDALATYFKPESLPLATQILDGMEIRQGYPLRVSEAVFTGDKSKNKNKKKKKPSSKIQQERVNKQRRLNQDRELSWNDEEDRVHIVLKHMFDPKEAVGDESFYPELKEEIKEECEKLGPLEKLHIFERNPEGVVVIKFKWPQSAEMCIEKMNGRFFGGNKIIAEYYDGVSNYYVEETEEEKQKRIEQFGNWLEEEEEEEEEKKDKKVKNNNNNSSKQDS